MKYKELKKRVRNYQDMLAVSNRVIYKQYLRIEMLEEKLREVMNKNTTDGDIK